MTLTTWNLTTVILKKRLYHMSAFRL
jgi:hypothetical protein